MQVINPIVYGLTPKKLELATALPEHVVEGKTFYAGDKEIKVGTRSGGTLKSASGLIPTSSLVTGSLKTYTFAIPNISKLHSFFIHSNPSYAGSYSNALMCSGSAYFGLDESPPTGYPQEVLMMYCYEKNYWSSYYTNQVSLFKFLNGNMTLTNSPSQYFPFNTEDRNGFSWWAFGE